MDIFEVMESGMLFAMKHLAEANQLPEDKKIDIKDFRMVRVKNKVYFYAHYGEYSCEIVYDGEIEGFTVKTYTKYETKHYWKRGDVKN